MLGEDFLRPSFDEWQKWAQVVIDRLATCVQVYSKPSIDNLFMPEKKRQEQNAKTVDLLQRFYLLVEDSASLKSPDIYQDERVIAELKLLMQEMLEILPHLSIDMQKLLKSPWKERCNGRLASELFCGPFGIENEGIGSGKPENGRLPYVLKVLLEREVGADRRKPRSQVESATENADPLHHDLTPLRSNDKGDLKRKWSEKTGEFMRRAGAVD